MERQQIGEGSVDWLHLPKMPGEIQKDNEKLTPADMAAQSWQKNASKERSK